MSDQQNNTQLSPKVSAALLDRMYNNFVKITSWIAKGEASGHAMPAPLQSLFTAAKTVEELRSLTTTLQDNLVKQSQQLEALRTQVAALTTQPTQQPVQQAAPASVQDELLDLDEAQTAPAATTGMSPNERAILVTAEMVDAGNLDPNSFQALDTELNSFLPPVASE